MRKTVATFGVVCGVALLGGCAFLRPEVLTRQSLLPVAAGVVAADKVTTQPMTVRVASPRVPGAYSEGRLVIVQGGELSYYAGQAWEAPLDDMLTSSLIRDLSAQLPGRVFVSADSSVQADRELQTSVLTFATYRDGGTSRVVMNIDVNVVDPNSRRVLRTLPFRYSAPLPALTTDATVAAYNAGWHALVQATAALLR